VTVTLMHSGLEAAAERFGTRDALRAGVDRWSFVDLDRLANGFAARLLDAGVAPGDRVAVMMRNRMEFPVIVHAISKIGAAAFNLAPCIAQARALSKSRRATPAKTAARTQKPLQVQRVTDCIADPTRTARLHAIDAVSRRVRIHRCIAARFGRLRPLPFGAGRAYARDAWRPPSPRRAASCARRG